jgi:CxxC-x17-CxxC domain-containing protein
MEVPGGGSGEELLLQDREFTCKECGSTFVFTVGEQEFYLTKGLQHAPQRCAECRRIGRASEFPARRATVSWPASGGTARKKEFGGQVGSEWARRQMTEIRCVQCGEVTMVPFQPRGDRPVYCKSCYAQARGMQGSEFR